MGNTGKPEIPKGYVLISNQMKFKIFKNKKYIFLG